MSLPINFALIQDIVLLLVSGLACLYCILLNRRLKGLTSLKSGVGASIVSLTKAIRETHVAAQSTQSETVETIESLEALLSKADVYSQNSEAQAIVLQRKIYTAMKLEAKLDELIEVTLPKKIEKAQATASNLLKIVTDVEKYRLNLEATPRVQQVEDAEEIIIESFETDKNDDVQIMKEEIIQYLPHLKVVSDNKDEKVLENTDHRSPAAAANTGKNDAVANEKPARKDPIDELFDDIDSLVKKKGVEQNNGFLKSRRYYKS